MHSEEPDKSYFRSLWLCVLVISSSWMSYNFYTRLQSYLDKPRNVDMSFGYTGIVDFPVITICNINNYRLVNLVILENKI